MKWCYYEWRETGEITLCTEFDELEIGMEGFDPIWYKGIFVPVIPKESDVAARENINLEIGTTQWGLVCAKDDIGKAKAESVI